jgi:hypothetical protein
MKISKFSPNAVLAQLWCMFKAPHFLLPYHLRFPRLYSPKPTRTNLVFQKDMFSQLLSPTNRFILSCLLARISVAHLLYEGLHFATTTGMHSVCHLLFPKNRHILSCLPADHTISDWLSSTKDFILS